MKRIVHAVIAGALFGLGLAVSGMTHPDKVLNFLDVAGQWDPSLALVMGAALAVAVPGFAWLRRRGCTIAGQPLPAPPEATIDRRLIVGSALFGVGWGLAGICPGPALALLALDGVSAVIFFAALVAGMALHRIGSRTAP